MTTILSLPDEMVGAGLLAWRLQKALSDTHIRYKCSWLCL